jgi:hypothetical protein
MYRLVVSVVLLGPIGMGHARGNDAKPAAPQPAVRRPRRAAVRVVPSSVSCRRPRRADHRVVPTTAFSRRSRRFAGGSVRSRLFGEKPIVDSLSVLLERKAWTAFLPYGSAVRKNGVGGGTEAGRLRLGTSRPHDNLPLPLDPSVRG